MWKCTAFDVPERNEREPKINFRRAINGLTTASSVLPPSKISFDSIFMIIFFFPSDFYLQRLPCVRSNWTQCSFFFHFDNFFFDMAKRGQAKCWNSKNRFGRLCSFHWAHKRPRIGGRNVAAACTVHNPHETCTVNIRKSYSPSCESYK